MGIRTSLRSRISAQWTVPPTTTSNLFPSHFCDWSVFGSLCSPLAFLRLVTTEYCVVRKEEFIHPSTFLRSCVCNLVYMHTFCRKKTYSLFYFHNSSPILSYNWSLFSVPYDKRPKQPLRFSVPIST